MATWKSATGKSRNTQKHFTTRLVNAVTMQVTVVGLEENSPEPSDTIVDRTSSDATD
jgi:hypothetical protein